MRVSSPTPTRRPAAAASKAAAPPVAAPATPAPSARPVGPTAAVPPGITVNVAGRVAADGGLGATGTVTLDRTFMERLVRQVTRKEAFLARDVRFDAATSSYKGSVKLKVKGIPLTLLGEAVPVADAGQPAFKLQRLGVKIGPFTLRWGFLKQLAAKLIAQEISKGGIVATAAPGGVIRLDPTTLLYDVDVLPRSLHLDTRRTQFGVKMAPNGDVRIQLKSEVPALAAASQGGSRLEMAIDEQAALRMLAPVLSPAYELRGVKLEAGVIKLDGQVEAKPLSTVVNLAKGLLVALARARGGAAGNASTEQVMVNLQLDAKLKGTEIVLTPSLALAVGELEKTLQAANLSPVREGNSLRFDVASLLARYKVGGVQVLPGEVRAQADLDINTLLKAPILRGEKW